MKETTFINQNKDKWKRFENLSKSKNNDPDEISTLFTEITEDLSYSRTFYPKRSVRIYLNQLAQGVFTTLYKQKKQPIKGFFKFWRLTVPLALYRSRSNLLMGFIFFMAAGILGAVSQYFDPSFAEIILGNSYLEATEQRIAEGNPMGIYGESEEVSMFLQITINNIQVSFLAFALGILYSFGSYYILLTNGIMLGAFQWWFYAKNLLLTSFLAIWIHGAFEISAIVIAGSAGITMGNGLLFPKSYSRLQSLIFSAKQGFYILISLVPVFIVAGFLESFVTRYYQSIPTVLNWFIILGSFGIIILYYVIYPRIIAKKYPDEIELKELPRYLQKRKIKLEQIKSTGKIFTDAIYTFIQKGGELYKQTLKLILPLSLLLGGVIAYYNFIALDYENYWYDNFDILFGLNNQAALYKYFSWSLILSITISLTIYTIHKNESKSIFLFFKNHLKTMIWQFLMICFLMLSFVFFNWFLFLITLLLLGFSILLTPIIIQIEGVNVFTAIGRSFKIIGGSYGQGIGNIFSIILISVIFFFILHNPYGYGLMMILNDFLENVLIGNTENYYLVINLINGFIYLIFVIFIVQLSYVNAYYFYYSQLEKLNADDLKANIETIGKRSKSFETSFEFE